MTQLSYAVGTVVAFVDPTQAPQENDDHGFIVTSCCAAGDAESGILYSINGSIVDEYEHSQLIHVADPTQETLDAAIAMMEDAESAELDDDEDLDEVEDKDAEE